MAVPRSSKGYASDKAIDMVSSYIPESAGRKRKSPSTWKCNQSHIDSYNCAVVSAIRMCNLEQLRDLLNDCDQSFDACNLNGEYLIHLACRRADLKTIKFLVLEAGVDVHVLDAMGRSILHDACWRANFEPDIMSFLLQVVHPAFLAMKDIRGHTPLNYVRPADMESCKEFLLKHRDLITRRLESCRTNKRRRTEQRQLSL